MTIRAHLAAVTALLQPLTVAPTNLAVDVAGVDDEAAPPTGGQPATPYVVVTPDGLPQVSDRLAGWSANIVGTIYVRHVGATWAEAAWAQEKTRARLLDQVPTVAGRSVAPLRMFDTEPVRVDRDEPTPLFYAVDVYRLWSAPAVGA